MPFFINFLLNSVFFSAIRSIYRRVGQGKTPPKSVHFFRKAFFTPYSSLLLVFQQHPMGAFFSDVSRTQEPRPKSSCDNKQGKDKDTGFSKTPFC